MSESGIKDIDRGWRDLFRRVDEIKNSYVKVGVLSESESGGMHEPGSDLTVAEIAVVNEFGTEDGTVPSRSFVRSTFDEKREEAVAIGKKLMGGVIDGKIGILQALNVMGSFMATAVKRKITDGAGVPPPNAPSTTRTKQAKGEGFVRTLVDTGRMLGAITWLAIVGGGEE